MYDSISKDVISRWAFPVSPDANITGGLTFTHYGRHVYKEKGVILSRTTTLEHHVAVGSGSQLGESTRLSQSVIGRNCRIGGLNSRNLKSGP
jgi:translation initiation factor eIF-2B subunit epsilon